MHCCGVVPLVFVCLVEEIYLTYGLRQIAMWPYCKMQMGDPQQLQPAVSSESAGRLFGFCFQLPFCPSSIFFWANTRKVAWLLKRANDKIRFYYVTLENYPIAQNSKQPS
jgi:hypothetical protein